MTNPSYSRRRFLAGAVAATGLAACRDISAPVGTDDPTAITARPGTPSRGIAPGRHALAVDWVRDGFLFVPASYNPSVPAPLVVLLHGAGGTSSTWSPSFLSLVDDLGIVVLCADSRAGTWDLIAFGGFGPDVRFLDLALRQAFDRCNIDPRRIALGGFSDGASYALSLGLMNGGLFTSLIAFSPGVVDAPTRRGMPRVFITHGSKDPVIPVTNSRDLIVPNLRAAGYDVTYVEFDGGHGVVRNLARQAFEWVAES